MCFSAAASFGAGAVLSGVGIYSLSITKNRKYLPLAAVPLLFGIQQLVEWGVWLWLHGQIGQEWLTICTYAFLFFSQIFWVVWVPFMVWYMEEKWTRKNIQGGLLILGLLLAWYLAYTLTVVPAEALIQGHHIVYNYAPLIISLKWLSVAVYMLATIVPLFIARLRSLKMLGLLLFLTAVVAYLFYTQAFISVWCFFAAIISAYVVYIIRSHGRQVS